MLRDLYTCEVERIHTESEQLKYRIAGDANATYKCLICNMYPKYYVSVKNKSEFYQTSSQKQKHNHTSVRK